MCSLTIKCVLFVADGPGVCVLARAEQALPGVCIHTHGRANAYVCVYVCLCTRKRRHVRMQEVFHCVRRDLVMRQKRPTNEQKRPMNALAYLRYAGGLALFQKRPSYAAKETYQ